jgi:quaternary ammonium compound-resistance protein SugE
MTHWLALLVSVMANIGSNFALKRFTNEAAASGEADTLLALMFKPWLWLGFSLAGVVMLAYLFALRGLPISSAYPIATGLSAAGICLIGALVYGEAVKVTTVSGIVLIIAGVMLVSR